MKEGWQIKKLGDICDINLGKTPERGTSILWDSDKKTNNIWLSISDLNNATNGIISNSKEYISEIAAQNVPLVKAGTLLMSFKLTIGRCAFAGTDLRTNEAIAALPLKIYNVNLKYLKYYLEGFNWKDFSKGDEKVKGATLNKKKLKIVPIIIAPLSEQQRIVDILDREFAMIDAVKSNAEQTLQNAKDLFQATLQQKLSPKEGWNLTSLPDISDNLDYKRIPITQNQRVKGVYPYYGASGIVDYVNNYIFDEDLLLISEDGANLLARSTPIAFSVSGKIWINNHAHVLRFKSKRLQSYVELFFESIPIDKYVTGAAQPKLTQSSLNRIPISIPPIKEVSDIVDNLHYRKEICKQIESNTQQIIAQCEALKQALLRKAFNGEL